MSSARGSAGSPWTVISRYVAFSFDLHCAVNRPGKVTQGVSIGRSGSTQGRAGFGLMIVRRSVERYAWRLPLPPPSAAGFVHAAVMLGSVTFPKRVLGGGGLVDRNEENAMTQPVCVAE